MKGIKNFKTIINVAKEYKIKLLITSIIIFICGFSYIFAGYLNGFAIESITNLNLKLAIGSLLIYLITEIVFDTIDRISMAYLEKIEMEISERISYITYQKTLGLPAYAFEEKTSGEFINRIINDTGTITDSFNQLIRIISNLTSSFIVLIYIFYNSYIIGIEIVLFIIIYGFVVKYYNPLLKKVHKERKKINDDTTSMVTESVRGIREIKTLGIKNSLFRNLQDLIKNTLNKFNQEIDLYAEYDIISGVLKSILEVGVFMTCAFLLYYGKTSLTFFVAMTYYIYRYTWIIENITSFTKIYNEVLVAVQRINEIIENKLFKDVKFGPTVLKKCQGIVKFENVTFNYPNEEAVLKNFNVEFTPHQKIGIVGKSGQGKSTIFNLLTRVFDTEIGKITIDGIDIKDLSEKSLRQNISIIRQEPFLFNKTIKENFLYIDKSLTLKEIRKFCKLAYIDDYIMSLPNNYNTILGEGGVNLSGGQKQRIAIARALAKKSKIILFDEATSALDNESQKYIKQVIDDLVKTHTIIIVAHRLSTIKDADIIYVIDNGEIKDSGTHQKLIKNSAIYKRLYNNENK